MNLEGQSSVKSIQEISRNLEFESIDFFVRLMRLLGLPRSVGEIYGLLYFTPSALTMDQIASRLEISIGSASQGLKTLRSLKAVKTTYVQGDRRDHYLAVGWSERKQDYLHQDQKHPDYVCILYQQHRYLLVELKVLEYYLNQKRDQLKSPFL